MFAILVLRTGLVLRLVFSRMEMQKEEAGKDRYVLETTMASHYVEKVLSFKVFFISVYKYTVYLLK